MKRYIKYMRMTMIAVVGLLLSVGVNAQIDNLGVVWENGKYTSLTGNFNNITKQTNGTYIATGMVIKEGKQIGYLVHFDEMGNKIDDYILTPPSSAAEWNTGTSTSYLSSAYLTSDNCIIAFGVVTNLTAATTYKGHNISGAATYGFLKNGLWVTKVSSADKSVKINKLDRNNSNLSGVYLHAPDQFLATGYDYQADKSNGCMLRLYDINANWLYDNYSATGKKIDVAYPSNITSLNTNTYVLGSLYDVYAINKSDFGLANGTLAASILVSGLKVGEGCIPSDTPGGPHPYFKQKENGNGFWISGRMGYMPTGPIQHLGSIFYEKTNNNELIKCEVIQPNTQTYTIRYQLPFLLPGSTTNYIGTKANTATGKSVMYTCTDDLSPTGGFTLNDYGDAHEFLYNTSLNATSHTDGFFSVGQHSVNKSPVIVKYSTCANFKIINLPTNNEILVNHAPSIDIDIPLNFEGAKAPAQSGVKCDLQAYVEVGRVNNITSADNGGQLENLSNQSVVGYDAGKGEGKALDLKRKYEFAEGPVVIKYILSIKDSYITAGVPQSCGQTYTFYLRSVPQSNIVAMPTIVKDGQGGATIKTSIKNVGLASFISPFNITVYKDAVGDATKHLYEFTNIIARNETVDFEITIPNFETTFAGATKIVVNFNDNGNGTIDQAELDPTVERDYEVSL